MQGLDDIGTDRDAADLLDLAPGDRLPIGDQGQGFQQRPRVLLGPLMPQPGDPLTEGLAHLKTEAAGHFLQFEAPAIAAGADFFQRRAYRVMVGALMFLEQVSQLGHGQRLARGQQGAFDNLYQSGFCHAIQPLP